MTSIYNAIAWFFDISFYQAIDVYDEMKSLGEDRQIEQIRRDYIKALLDTTCDDLTRRYCDADADALADYQKLRLSSVYGRFGDA